MENKNIKVLFVQKVGDEEFETESLWCLIGDNFIVDNIPFIAKRISLGDTIKVEFDEDDQQYYFDDFVASSGNTTVRIYFEDDEIEIVRKWLSENGCESEVLQARKIIAVNIPREVDYSPIKKYLDNGENSGVWTYEESCLEHSY